MVLDLHQGGRIFGEKFWEWEKWVVVDGTGDWSDGVLEYWSTGVLEYWSVGL